jgi:hypothetical protein
MPDDQLASVNETAALLHSFVAPLSCRAREVQACLYDVLCSPYFWANVVYLVYTCEALAVDFCSVSLHPPVFAPAPAPDAALPGPPPPGWTRRKAWLTAPECAETGDSAVYAQYIALAAVHLVNAFQYLYLWRPWFALHARGRAPLFLACILFPELLNVLEASLYLHTATRYAAVQSDPACVERSSPGSWHHCAGLMQVHRTELGAAAIELVASLFWLWSWLATHEAAPHRGLTLWDLDCHSSFLLVLGSLIYVVYNLQIAYQPERYGSAELYKVADVIYFVGAVLYMLASLRDVGCFHWLPGGATEEKQGAAREKPHELELAPLGVGGKLGGSEEGEKHVAGEA